MKQNDYMSEGHQASGNALQFKEHKDFFEKLHNLRSIFLESHAESYFNSSEIKECVKVLMGLVNHTSIYIQKMHKYDEIDADIKECILLLRKNENNKLQIKTKRVFNKLNEIYEFNEMIPQVREIKKDETEGADVKVKHALTAYNLLYGKN